MTFSDLKSSIQSRIWDLIYKNNWTETDDFSLNLSEKIAGKVIKRKSRIGLVTIVDGIKTTFFKVNSITKKEFAKELSDDLEDLLQLYKPLKSKGKKKSKKTSTSTPRLGFSDEIKIKTLRNQDHLCANCSRILTVLDWDHKDGNRSNNDESNCRALCPSCHAVVTRKRQMK